MVHGGDGFAFVLHSHPNRTETLGKGGSDMGYGGEGLRLLGVGKKGGSGTN